MPHPLQTLLLQLCPVTKEIPQASPPDHSIQILSSGLEFLNRFQIGQYIRLSIPVSPLDVCLHPATQRSVWSPPTAHPRHLPLARGLRLNSCLSRRTHTVPGTVLDTTAPMISLDSDNSTSFHCRLAHVFQLILFDSQGIHITHDVPDASRVIGRKALSCSALAQSQQLIRVSLFGGALCASLFSSTKRGCREGSVNRC